MVIRGILRCALRAPQQSIKGLSLNKNLSWDYVLEHPEGFYGMPWDLENLSWNKSNNIMKTFLKLPFTKKEFKDELKFKANEIKYVPGNSSYRESKLHFEGMCKNFDRI